MDNFKIREILNFLCSPYGKDFLLALKKARVKQVRSEAVANELFTYVIFLIVLFIISYANRDQDSYKIKNHIGKWECSNSKSDIDEYNLQERNLVGKYGFDKVKTSDDWWRWAHAALVKELKVNVIRDRDILWTLD